MPSRPTVADMFGSRHVKSIHPAGTCAGQMIGLSHVDSPDEQEFMAGEQAAQNILTEGRSPEWWDGFRTRLNTELGEGPKPHWKE